MPGETPLVRAGAESTSSASFSRSLRSFWDDPGMTAPVSDFRSDTVTKPTPKMRRAMAEAEVGDDVYGEDPTIRRLEERTAEVLGKEAALFVPTGSMGNQLSLRVHARSGTEVILEGRSHIFHYEMAGMAALSGLMPRPVDAPRGRMTIEQVAAWIRPASVYYLPRTSVLALENTHNFAGGAVVPRSVIDPLLALATENGLATHLDGARLWNAAAALGVSAASLAAGFDSVMTCFSKGLRAPVGSAVTGSKAFIAEARRVRKLFGGGMRQAGVIAAAALVALEDERERLPEDHARAKKLAEGLAGISGISLDVMTVETNIVIFFLGGIWAPAQDVVAKLASHGVLAGAAGPSSIRMVTHADVGDADVDRALRAFEEISPARPAGR
jgi:threonine aldolase